MGGAQTAQPASASIVGKSRLSHIPGGNPNVRLESEDGPLAPPGEATQTPTQDELRERLRQKRNLDRDIRRLQKEIKRSERAKKQNRRATSEPISPKLQNMISQITERTRESRDRGRTRPGLGQEMRPLSQVTKGSALGQAFERIREDTDTELSEASDATPPTSPDGSSSEDDSDPYLSSEDDSLDYSDSSSSSGEETGKTRCKPKKRIKRREVRKNKSIIRPTPPPAKYNGLPDLQAFLQFMTHCTSYVRYGLVEKEHQVLVVSEFLTRRAWTFYSREALRAPEEWALEKFLKGLFNECFPINYRNKQRNKLQNLRQGKWTVRDYVGELQELFTIVESTNRKEKVVKLFNGFRPSI